MRIRILIGMAVMWIRFLIGTTVVRIAIVKILFIYYDWQLIDLKLGLQQYTKLSSIRNMGSGKPAYCIASRIFARFTNFLEPVIILKIIKFPDKICLCWQPLFPVKCIWFPIDAQICFCTSGPSKSKNINYWKIHS